MPIVRVDLWPGRTKEQKKELVKAITDAVETVMGTAPDRTTVIFTEVSKDDWAQGGKLASES